MRSRAGAARPVRRVRWDRLGRLAMLCVLAALLYLYISAGIRLFSTWREARGDNAQVSALQREHTLLERKRAALRQRGTLEQEARELGMMHPGEQPYVVAGLPNN
jgi:cell division protein FtsB